MMTRNSQRRPGSSQARRFEDAPEMLLDGRYRLVRLLGEGGMGAVYLAEHVRLKTLVALKFLHVELAGRDEALMRFEREARVAASLRHNHIIQIFDVGSSDNGEPFIVMEYLEGESLADLMKRVGRLDLESACGVIEPALLALQAAQRKGIIHRDLKPDNVFLARQPEGPPVVKIIDFGLSKLETSGQDPSRTQSGSVLGTLAYMSPEQARGQTALDHRTDLYSVGVMLFEMLTGGLPYSGGPAPEYLANLLVEEPRAPREVNASFPMAADAFVRKAIRKNPDERFQSATEMLDALALLPGFAARAERLARIGSSRDRSSVAVGDLGRDVGRPVRHAPKRLVGGAMVATTLLVVAAAVGVYLWTSPGARAPGTKPSAPLVPEWATAGSPIPTSAPGVGRGEGADAERGTMPEATRVAEPVQPTNPTRGPAKPATASTRKRAKTSDGQLLRGNRGIEMSEQFE